LENDAVTLQKEWSLQTPPSRYRSFEYPLATQTFCFPFVEQVFPFIPRLLVQNIFNLDDPNVSQGFFEFIQMAHKNRSKVIEGFQKAWPNQLIIQNMLNRAWFSPDGEGPQIVIARIEQLHRIVNAIPQGCQKPQAFFQIALLDDLKSFMEHQRKSGLKPG
jgi:hypothetical protein